MSRLDDVGVFKELVDVPGAEQAKRFSAHDFFSGKILFPDATLAMEASAIARNENFIFLVGSMVLLK